MGGMGDIRQAVHMKQLEVLQLLGRALQQEELDLQQVQNNLVHARQLVDGALGVDGGLEAATDGAQLDNAGATTPKEILEEQIRRRAAEIFAEHGSEAGHDLEYWLQAETEVLAQSTRSEIAPAEGTPSAKDHSASVEEQIRLRAAEIFAERGGEAGHDLEYWLQAEAEILARLTAADERRRYSQRRNAERRVVCIGSPTGTERRCGQDRRRSELRRTVAGQA